jgi:AraC-like DNA-binding protein
MQGGKFYSPAFYILIMGFSIKNLQALKALRPYIHTYWYGRFNTGRSTNFVQKVIPNGFVELIIHLSERHCSLYQDSVWSQSPDYTLIGMFTQPYEVQFDHLVNVFGVRFKPEGILNLFGIPSAEFCGNYFDMETVLSKSFTSFSNRIRGQKDIHSMINIANDYFLDCLSKNSIEPYYLNRAAEYIRLRDGLIRTDDLAGKVFISNRQLEREFKSKIGITPKQYIRISRLNAVNRQLQNREFESLTSISYHYGFADQAHFIREFKAFSGFSPTRFLKGRDEFIVNV